jgi:hypothetical protein
MCASPLVRRLLFLLFCDQILLVSHVLVKIPRTKLYEDSHIGSRAVLMRNVCNVYVIICMYVYECIYIYMHVYVCMYLERESEKERYLTTDCQMF